jgi:diaminobutyrate acetyltransferase
MQRIKEYLKFRIRNIVLPDIKEVYKLLVANRPYVGLNSRYTYFLLAKDFSDTCVVAEQDNKIIAFSSGYVPPDRRDTFFNWEVVVQRLPRIRPTKTHASSPNQNNRRKIF